MENIQIVSTFAIKRKLIHFRVALDALNINKSMQIKCLFFPLDEDKLLIKSKRVSKLNAGLLRNFSGSKILLCSLK